MTRFEKLKELLLENGLDGFFVNSRENHRYISGFDNPDGCLLVTPETVYVFADFRYTEAAEREAEPWCTVIMPNGTVRDFLPEYTLGMKTVAVEESALTLREYRELSAALPDTELREGGRMLSGMRRIKSREEIGLIVAAQRIAERSLDCLISNMTRNMTEREVAAELEYQMKKNGSEGASFDTIAVSGSQSSSPHGVPRECVLEDGFLTLDFGATVCGYHSDMTRTFVIGRADCEMKRLYNTVLRAQAAGLEAVKAGARNRECDMAAREIIGEAGYAGCFGHSLGHGVGLLIHEAPNLSPRSPEHEILIPGEVVTVEPGIYISGKYGCRIEDTVYITDGKTENLTEYPKELVELF